MCSKDVISLCSTSESRPALWMWITQRNNVRFLPGTATYKLCSFHYVFVACNKWMCFSCSSLYQSPAMTEINAWFFHYIVYTRTKPAVSEGKIGLLRSTSWFVTGWSHVTFNLSKGTEMTIKKEMWYTLTQSYWQQWWPNNHNYRKSAHETLAICGVWHT